MDDIVFSALAGCVVGAVGTGTGALLSFIVKGTYKRFPSIVMGYAAGIMLGVVFLDMLPAALSLAGVRTGVFSMFLGALFVILLNLLLPHYNPTPESEYKAPAMQSRRKAPLVRTGLLLCSGIAIHNFPEGLAVGSGITAASEYGIGLALLLLVHNIPEGIAMSVPLRLGGLKKKNIFLLAVVTGLPTALGAAAGSLIGNISAAFIGGAIAFAGGAMLYITVMELIPESWHMHKGRATAAAAAAGFLTASTIILLV